MVLLIGRWLFIYYGFINFDIQNRNRDIYYVDSQGNRKRKSFLKENDLRNMTMEQLDMLEKSGIYLMPLEFEEALENFRHSKTLKSQDFGMFNYKKNKLDLFDPEHIASKQAENIKAQNKL